MNKRNEYIKVLNGEKVSQEKKDKYDFNGKKNGYEVTDYNKFHEMKQNNFWTGYFFVIMFIILAISLYVNGYTDGKEVALNMCEYLV